MTKELENMLQREYERKLDYAYRLYFPIRYFFKKLKLKVIEYLNKSD